MAVCARASVLVFFWLHWINICTSACQLPIRIEIIEFRSMIQSICVVDWPRK